MADADIQNTEPPQTTPRLRRFAVLLAVACALLTLMLGARRLSQVERHELDLETQPQTLRVARTLPSATKLSARLAEVRLTHDQHAVFELCALGALSSTAFHDAFEILILQAEAKRLMLRVPLDAAHLQHVQGDGQHSCLLLGSGLIEHTGTYRVEAVWPKHPPPQAAVGVDLWVHVQASPVLTRRDLAMLLGLGGAVLLGLLFALRDLPLTPQNAAASPRPRSSWFGHVLLPISALALLYLAMQWPSRGGLYTLCKGCVLLALQLLLPFLLVSRSGERDVPSVLGLTRVKRPLLSTALALAAVPLLVATARLSLRIIPSTQVAPIQTFIAWPSGMLSAALLGAVLPLGEELFFRGYLLGIWLRYGRAIAAAASVLAFTLLHVEQSWGNWGGLLAIFLTGTVLCGLRLVTGSCALSAISHVAYNLTLSASTLAAALDK